MVCVCAGVPVCAVMTKCDVGRLERKNRLNDDETAIKIPPFNWLCEACVIFRAHCFSQINILINNFIFVFLVFAANSDDHLRMHRIERLGTGVLFQTFVS